jgi:polyisoprenoid-binding protein YceI
VTGQHEGSFKTFSGSVQLVDHAPEQSSVKVDIDMASVEVEPAKLAAHLKSPDFFDVAKYPKASFESTAIKAGGTNGATHTVTGNLTLHGTTRSISFPAKIQVNGDNVRVNAEFAINRKDFGVVYPGMPDDLINDSVLIRLNLGANRS